MLVTSKHNNPPDGDAITLRLQDEHADLIARRDELIGCESRVPDIIGDEETAQKVSDFIVQIQKCAKNTEALRVKAKEPFIDGGRRVDGFFKGISEPMGGVKARVAGKLTAYHKLKAAEERRIREAAEADARKAADEAAAHAREAAAKMEKEADLARAIEAEKEAAEAEAMATRAKKIASAPAADVSRTRSAAGSVGGLRTFWAFRNIDRDGLDLEALRQHIPADAIERAIRAFIKAGGRTLSGVEIYEDHQTVVR